MPSINPRSIEIDEVISAQGRKDAAGTAGRGSQEPSELSIFLARWLDDLLRIPGTRFRIGLDPILALIPGVGDAASTGAGMFILLDALRSGVSASVLLRMAGNMGFNALLGLIPGIGQAASAFFKSNRRNLHLLKRWQAGDQRAVRRSTLRIFLIVAVLIACLGALWVASIWMFMHYVLGLGRA